MKDTNKILLKFDNCSNTTTILKEKQNGGTKTWDMPSRTAKVAEPLIGGHFAVWYAFGVNGERERERKREKGGEEEERIKSFI